MKTYDEAALLKFERLLLAKPRTLAQLASAFGRHQRTIKRWLALMRGRGLRVLREGVGADAPYFLARP